MKSNILLIIGLGFWLLSSFYSSWSIHSKSIQIAILNEKLSHLKEKNTISDSLISISHKTIDSLKNKIDTIYITRQIIHTQTHEKERDAVKLPIDDKIKLLSRNLQKSYKDSNR